MGFVPIQELEDAVGDRDKVFSNASALAEIHDKRFTEFQEQLEHSRNLLNTTTQNYELQVSYLKLELNEAKEHIITKERMNAVLLTELTLVKKLFDESREENKQTREMIYLRTGMKREDVINVPEDEDKELKSVHTSPKTRSSIKRQLELRAERLLKAQQAKEDQQIVKGDLAPSEDRTH